MLAQGGVRAPRQAWARRVAATVVLASGGAAWAVPLSPGDAAFKTHASVPGMPKYTVGLPAYFVPANVRGTLVSAISGGLLGTATTTVYENPSTGFLTFQYFFESASNSPQPIARATIGGMWAGVAITDAGADGSGLSGTGDPGAEWLDGDPLFVDRDPISHAPAVQWRAFGLGAAIAANDRSSLVWFETDQTLFEVARVGVIDTAVVGAGEILAPLTASKLIPLPTAAGLALAGLGLAGARRRRKF